MSNNITWRLNRKLEWAVLLIDDFTDRKITGSGFKLSVHGDPKRKPIKKNDGYFVFIAEETPIDEIQVESIFYVKETVKVSRENREEKGPILKIRLKPNGSYPLPGGTTCIEGKAKPGDLLEVICKDVLGQAKLFNDYKKDDKSEIQIFRTDNLEIDGKYFAIVGKDGKNPEVFKILGKIQDSEEKYALEQPLKKEYLKKDSRILPVYRAIADEKGKYILPMRDAVGEICSLILSINGEKGKEIKIDGGKTTTMNFDV